MTAFIPSSLGWQCLSAFYIARTGLGALTFFRGGAPWPVCPMMAHAADLTKLDRTLKKERAYTGKPSYCFLVLGPEAKTRV